MLVWLGFPLVILDQEGTTIINITSKKNSSQLPSENKASSNLGQNP